MLFPDIGKTLNLYDVVYTIRWEFDGTERPITLENFSEVMGISISQVLLVATRLNFAAFSHGMEKDLGKTHTFLM